MRSDAQEDDARLRADATWFVVAAIEFAVLVILSAVLISFFAGSGFWPWLVMAGALLLGWLTAVILVIPRSAPRGPR